MRGKRYKPFGEFTEHVDDASQSHDAHFAAKYGWQKMQQVFRGLGPNKTGNIIVHYQINRRMPDVAWDVKVVSHGGYQ